MKHAKLFRKLGRTETHRQCLFRNQVTQLFQYERIETTVAKAKDLRRYADRVITMAKKQTPKWTARVYSYVRKNSVARKVCRELSQRFENREGGYTRVLKTRFRRGDCAPMAMVELSETPFSILTTEDLERKEERKTKHRRPKVGLAQLID